MSSAVPEGVAHSVAEELSVARLHALTHLVAVQLQHRLAASTRARHSLVARRARASVAPKRALMATRASLWARLSTCRNRRQAVWSRIARKLRQRRCSTGAPNNDDRGSRARRGRDRVRVAALGTRVHAALVHLGTSALASKPADPLLVLRRTQLLVLGVPAARNDLFVLPAIATHGLHLVTRRARTEVTQLITLVLAAAALLRARLVANGC